LPKLGLKRLKKSCFKCASFTLNSLKREKAKVLEAFQAPKKISLRKVYALRKNLKKLLQAFKSSTSKLMLTSVFQFPRHSIFITVELSNKISDTISG
jgi:hypothetical protein